MNDTIVIDTEQPTELNETQKKVLENFKRVTAQKPGIYNGRLVMIDEKLFTIKKIHNRDVTLRLFQE